MSVHTTLAAANNAAKNFFDIDSDDDDMEAESQWLSWEDLCGTRVQTDSEGKVRVIRTLDTQGEQLAWVEKKVILST
jgi:hypothetical protein